MDPPRPASYALEKLNNLEYVELDYFTALKAIKEHPKDEDLSWEEMLEAKNTMLYFMTQSDSGPLLTLSLWQPSLSRSSGTLGG
jgi:hypothetical protein